MTGGREFFSRMEHPALQSALPAHCFNRSSVRCAISSRIESALVLDLPSRMASRWDCRYSPAARMCWQTPGIAHVHVALAGPLAGIETEQGGTLIRRTPSLSPAI